MSAILASLAILAAGALLPGLLWRQPRLGLRVALVAALVAAAVGIAPAIAALLGAPVEERSWSWQAPLGGFAVGLDPLSGFFLVPILVVTALSALAGHRALADRGDRRAVAAACFSNALTFSMVLVVVARDAILFLVAWETMSLASYFLVTFDDHDPQVQDAGFVYLVATHLGTAFLLVFFSVLGLERGSFLFSTFAGALASHPARHLLFACALVGFGAKAGIAPLHVWLPRAHPAAPSPVSAVMSGVMIKTGIYGLLRALAWLGPPGAAWGYVLLVLGLVSALGGVLFALAQHDLKRMLAYHSVENIGIICLGIGAGLLGRTLGNPLVEVLGFGGALLHVWNHAAFKSLLFLSAGAAVHSTHERDIDRMGGLLRRMPFTGALFLVGSAAICGLPPLNGFVSEWLVYWSLFQGGGHLTAWPALACLVAAAGLALVGALALACFAKATGICFLGEPRSEACAGARDPEPASRTAMAGLGAACLALGLLPAAALRAGRDSIALLVPDPASASALLERAGEAAGRVGEVGVGLLVLVALALAGRRLVLRGRAVSRRRTWGCGYPWPTPRMQYSGSSFARPLLELFRGIVSPTVHGDPVEGFFPRRASLRQHTEDPAERRLFQPAFASIPDFLRRFRWMQEVPVQVQLLYIVLALMGFLVAALMGTGVAR